MPLQDTPIGIDYLPCDTTTNFVTYTLADGTPISYETTAGPLTGSDFGRCGTGFFQLSYTQACLNHDACVYDTDGYRTPGDENCGGEFDDAIVDTTLGLGYCDNGVVSFLGRSPASPGGHGGCGSPTTGEAATSVETSVKA